MSCNPIGGSLIKSVSSVIYIVCITQCISVCVAVSQNSEANSNTTNCLYKELEFCLYHSKYSRHICTVKMLSAECVKCLQDWRVDLKKTDGFKNPFSLTRASLLSVERIKQPKSFQTRILFARLKKTLY